MLPGKLFSQSISDFLKAKRFAQTGRQVPSSNPTNAALHHSGFHAKPIASVRLRKRSSQCRDHRRRTLETLMNEHPGEIKAQIVEDNGQVIMRKTCPKHGEFDRCDGYRSGVS